MWENFPNWGEGSDPNPLHIFLCFFPIQGLIKWQKNGKKNVKIPKLGGEGEGVRHLGIFPTQSRFFLTTTLSPNIIEDFAGIKNGTF